LQTLPDEIFRATLQPGQGLISNNMLHDRSGFDDYGEHKRQLYRLRYCQRMNGEEDGFFKRQETVEG